ncbi:MAG: hypothetical protein EA001_07935 [Oscillatoriales cyanobacterium]|nr:MAG: hypothetical protein EA001_07935 [Oscillatoriales cyanobacterium]
MIVQRQNAIGWVNLGLGQSGLGSIWAWVNLGLGQSGAVGISADEQPATPRSPEIVSLGQSPLSSHR